MERDARPSPGGPAPRILLVMPDHWPRALLRAELLERGHDAVGAPDVRTALLCRPVESDRGPVRAILVDQDTLDDAGSRLVELLLSRHAHARALLLANALLERPAGPWWRILPRPVSLGRLAVEIEDALGADAASPRDGE